MSVPPRVASVRIVAPRKIAVAYLGIQGPPGTGGGGAVDSINGRTGAVTLTKADVDLDQVDNTSDADKPVSTAQAAAIADAITDHESASDPHPGYATDGELSAGLAGKANATHSHAATDISDSTSVGRAVLTAADAAAARAAIGTDAPGDTRPPTTHGHAIGDVTGLTAALGDKLDVSHAGSGGAAHAEATGSVAGFMSAADKAKLDGIAAGATANAADAALRDRATHTGTQTASTISDFAAAVRAQIESALIEGANVTITYAGSGATRTLTIAAAGGGGSAPPAVRSIAYANFGAL